jgi:glycosyltransferase involved in cell wall biosynthesis
MSGLDIIAVTYGQDEILKCFINCIKAQTNDNWTLHIVHDGPNQALGEDLRDNGYLVKEKVIFYESERRTGHHGHFLRSWALKNVVTREYVLITNGDNYYVPVMVDHVLQSPADFIYFDCIHNYPSPVFHNRSSYGYLTAELRFGHIDMGCVAIKSSLAQKVGFNHSHPCADWDYFKEVLATQPTTRRIDKILFVHN